MYEYRATVLHVVDGDTVDLSVSLGFEMKTETRFRLLGINTPESYGPGASPAGQAAKAFVQAALPAGTPLVIRTEKDRKEKYGRYLVTLFVCDAKGVPAATSLNQQLVDRGHAKAYDGKGVKPV